MATLNIDKYNKQHYNQLHKLLKEYNTTTQLITQHISTLCSYIDKLYAVQDGLDALRKQQKTPAAGSPTNTAAVVQAPDMALQSIGVLAQHPDALSTLHSTYLIHIHLAYKTLQSNYTMYNLNVSDVNTCLDTYFDDVHKYLFNLPPSSAVDTEHSNTGTATLPSLQQQLEQHRTLFQRVSTHQQYVRQLYEQHINKPTQLLTLSEKQRDALISDVQQQNVLDSAEMNKTIDAVYKS